MTSFIPMSLNYPERVNVAELVKNEKIIVIDNFYDDIKWLKDNTIAKATNQSTSEKVFHLPPSIRYALLEKVSALFPDLYYPSDSGWIRSSIICDKEKPTTAYLHSDSPYIVISICLSSPEESDTVKHQGTTFYRHRDFGFKKIYGCKNSDQFKKIFFAHKDIDEMWEPWFNYSFVENRAIIYDGSLLHKMPWPVFGTNLNNSRQMQIFNFRLKSTDIINSLEKL